MKHAASCIAANTNYTQIMINGGSEEDIVYDDMWLLDVNSMTWKKVR